MTLIRGGTPAAVQAKTHTAQADVGSHVAQTQQLRELAQPQTTAQALNAGVVGVESAGQRSVELRGHTSGGAGYANQAAVDLATTSALGGHNLGVDRNGALAAAGDNKRTDEAKAIAQIAARAELKSVPTVRDLEAMKVGARSPDALAAALKQSLLSSNPAVVQKAAQTLRTAESYARKAALDEKNYAGTGFWPMKFPRLEVKLNADETRKVLQNLVSGRSPEPVGAMMLAARAGLVRTEPPGAFSDHQRLRELWPAGRTATVPGSQGVEVPGRGSFIKEYIEDVEPGERNIKEVIVDTAKANGGMCPFAQGNHAKGVSFDNGRFKVDQDAPEWLRDLVGNDPLPGVMMRISTSHTSPNDHDKDPAQTGVRLVIPVIGKAGESGSSTWDVTANTGSVTHRPNAREHTEFTRTLSVPRPGLAGLKPVKAARYLLGGVRRFNLLDRVKGIVAALEPTKEAASKPFDEQNLYARHTLFIGGRYVQVRYDVVDPTDFKVPKKSQANGMLDTKSEGIRQHGVKIRIYMKELPPNADPTLVEKEGWTNADLEPGQKFKEFAFGEVSFNPQSSDPASSASRFFEKYAHIPGRQSQIARGVGMIGRERSPVYAASEWQRHQPR